MRLPQITGYTAGAGNEVSGLGTNTQFPEAVISSSLQTSAAWLLSGATKQMEVHNSQSANGWTATLAVAGGESVQWTSSAPPPNQGAYPYNSTAASGRMGVNMSASTVQGVGTALNGSACSSSTGITKPSTTSYFANGSVSSITLLSGSASSQLGCTWRLNNVELIQTIPAYQRSGDYGLEMTLTVVGM